MQRGLPGVLHGARTYLLQDADGQTLAVALDLGRPGLSRASGPSTPGCTTPAGPRTGRSPTPRRWTRSAARRTEGIIPAIETAHALAGALDLGRELGPDADRAGEPVRPRRQGRRHGGALVRSGVLADGGSMTAMPATFAPSKLNETLARCKAEGRAALVGYLPAVSDTRPRDRGPAGDGRGRRRRGRGRPAVHRPGDGRARRSSAVARRALRAGSTTARVLRTVEAVARTGVADASS